MPNRKKRARRRQGGAGVILPVLIVFVAIAAAALGILLYYSNPFAPERRGGLPYDYEGLNFAEPGEATAAPLVLGSAATPEPVEGAPTDIPEPAASPAPEEEAAEERQASVETAGNRLVPTPMPGDYFLPVFDRALRTPDDRAMIAITVDGCDDPEVMTQILNIADIYDAELTLFPTGNALMTLSSAFRTCVSALHYELENCTFDADKKDYSMSSGELALQIWRQSIAASYAMGRDYQEHFYRPKSMESIYDQRTHFYIRKLGFLGIAGYTHSYKDNDIDSLVASLANGNIYQFDMSEKSMELFETFIEEASRKGYKLVTMNELFGLDSNGVGASLTIDQQNLPEMNDYVPTYYDLKLNYRTNAVYTLQSKLISLGFLTGENGQTIRADGIYGAETSIAVSAYQASVGLVATGNADVETQRKLFGEEAEKAEEEEVSADVG